jgi:pimeloyl-ACP methyl ester carboxylesterase
LRGRQTLESILPIQSQICGDPVITNLIGGSPSEVPDRYRQASPSNLLPIRVKQVLISGAQDKVVPPWLGQKYQEEAKKVGDDVSFVAVENASHFEVNCTGVRSLA